MDAVDARRRAVSALRTEVVGARRAIGDDPAGDDLEAAGDLELLELALDDRLFWDDQWPRWQRDPLAALEEVSGGLHELLRRVDLPEEDQAVLAEAAVSRARSVPRLLEQAGRLLEGAPAPHLEVAMRRLDGILSLVRDDLPARVSTLGGDVAAAEDAGAVAAEGIAAFGALLSELGEAERLPWRLGPELHAERLRSALGTRMPAKEIARRAESALDERHDELLDTVRRHWDELVGADQSPPDDDEAAIRAALDAVAATAVIPEQLLDEARRAVDDARAWSEDADFVDLPPAEQLTVTEVPPFLQGVAVAFITSPPPLESDAGSTYYLSPVPESWDEAKAHSFLREYNPATLRSLALHEAVPGHFVQLEHAARHPRLARRMLGSSAFAEGWAVYAEREMVRRGYGTPAYRVVQAKLELRVAANALLDIGLHAGDLEADDALDLLTARTFQEDAEAHGKLVRGQITSGQLCSYFAGGEELADLRAEADDRNLRRFHQHLLAHGTPTPSLMRRTLAARSHQPPNRPFRANP